jgi:hypothetical protein
MTVWSEPDVRAAGEHEREKRAHRDQQPLGQLHALPPPSLVDGRWVALPALHIPLVLQAPRLGEGRPDYRGSPD